MAPIAELAQARQSEQYFGFAEYDLPVVNKLLENYPLYSVFIKKEDIPSIVSHADTMQDLFLNDQMVRQIDKSGFVPDFIGRCDNKDQVQTELEQIAKDAFMLLREEPMIVQKKVKQTLIGVNCDIYAAIWLDKQHGRAIEKLKLQRTDEAIKFRERNIEAIHEATQGKREILYVPTYNMDRLVRMTRFAKIPQLPEENQKILNELTPDCFKRQSTYKDEPPRTYVGFMQRFRIWGDPFGRNLIEGLRDKFEIDQLAQVIANQS